jgi:HEAT repeat protein
MAINAESDLYILAWQRVRQLTNAELLCFVRSKNALVRDLVIREFHVRPSREVLEIGLSLVRDGKAVARASGYLILGQLGSPNRPFRDDSMPAIMRGIESEKSPSVRCAIAYAIGHLVPPGVFHEQIIDSLLRYLDAKSESLRVAVAFAVAGLSLSDRLDQLVKRLLADSDQDVREWVEISLDAIKQRECAD